MKTKKSVTKRFKITKTGKVLRRPSGLDHYLAKKPGDKKRKSRKRTEMPKPQAKKIKQLLKG